MRLYCWSCNVVHTLTEGEVERIVYALGAEACEAPDMVRHEEPACLTAVLEGSFDSEVYLEHVEQGIECRKLGPADLKTDNQEGR